MKRGFDWLGLGLSLSISMLLSVGCSDKAALDTEVEPFNGLTLVPPNRTVERGESIQFAVSRIQNGESENVTQGTSWTLSDPTIAELDSRGSLIAKKAGAVRVTAEVDGLSKSTSVYVLGRPVDIQLWPLSVEFAKGTTASLIPTVISEDNTKRAMSGDETWASGAPQIAQVSGGTVRGVAPGEATIVLSSRGRTFSRTVKVLDVALQSIEPDTLSGPPLLVGQSTSLFANGQFTGGYTQDVSEYVSFELADKASEEVITLAGDTLRGLKPGRATIKVAGIKGTLAEGQQGQVTVDVAEGPSAISLQGPAQVSLRGEPFSVRVNGTVGDGISIVSGMATLTAKPADVLLISGTTMTPVKEGEVTLTATVTVGETPLKSTLTVRVVDAPLSSVAIRSTGNATTLAVNKTLGLIGEATFGQGITQTITRQLLWLSDKPSVAYVDNLAGTSGMVTGLSEGTATIKAFYRGQEVGTKTLTVTPP
jgi:uncharacterized protein YjdB